MKQILFGFLLVASLAALAVKADDVVDPLTFDIGRREDGDQLQDMYYGSSEETAERTTHSITIDWEYTNINFIRLYVEAVSIKSSSRCRSISRFEPP